jgi:hypothetical protein
MRLHAVALLAGALSVSAPSPLRAQAQPISFAPLRRDTIVAAQTVTAPFTISNTSGDTLRLMPHVDLPDNWSALTGTTDIVLAPGASTLWLLTFVAPAKTPAGVYPARVALTSPQLFSLATDSVQVLVPARHSLRLELLDAPSYVIVPRPYEAVFALRNAGNTRASARVTVRSRLGIAEISGDPSVTLAPDETRSVRVRVVAPALASAEDDVVEVFATSDDSTHDATGSVRVTLVPEPDSRLDAFRTMPAQIKLRTAGASAAGAAPFELSAAGWLREDRNERVELQLRGRGARHTCFAENDEYRIAISSPGWRARLGDHLYAASLLTSTGRAGFGAGADIDRERWYAGAFGQEFRLDPARDREVGGLVGARAGAFGLALNGVSRNTPGTGASTQIVSASGTFASTLDRGELEIAQSTGTLGAATAARARVNGSHAGVSYDGGLVAMENGFGAARLGSTQAYAGLSARPWTITSLSLMASSRTQAGDSTLGEPIGQRRDFLTLGATFPRRLTVEAGAATRSGALGQGQQQSLRLHTTQWWRSFRAIMSAERGIVRGATDSSTSFTLLHAALHTDWKGERLSAFVTHQDGASLTHGSEGHTAIGADASLELKMLDVSIRASAQTARPRTSPTPSRSWRPYADARVAHTLRNGSTIAARGRYMTQSEDAERSALYLEYVMPMQLPIGRLRTPGRVQGRIVDAASGRGVANALVRVGAKVAVTDAQGRVAFRGVPAGEHRVSLTQQQSLADAVFLGDPTVRIDSSQRRPQEFRLAVARGATLRVTVRRFEAARTALNGGLDSLMTAGPLAEISIALTNARDTLFGQSDGMGRVSFNDVPPGEWQVVVESDAPPHHQFEPDRLAVTLAPGDQRAVAFNLMPRQREVKVIGPSEELRPIQPQSRKTRSN